MAVAIVVEMVTATGEGMFHTLLLFGAWTFAIWIYVFPVSWRRVIIPGIVGLLLLTTIQLTKSEFRQLASSGDISESSLGRVTTWLSQLGRSVMELAQGNVNDQEVGDFIVRFNQGWIVNDVIQHVPSLEPYAEGETLLAALNSALFPRFIAPEKVGAGGRESMARYAGVTLVHETSMNLGCAGEMYANFGLTGGIIGCGFYALFFACVSRWIYVRAYRTALWWSYIPFVGFSAIKAEDGVGVVLNWFLKAVFVLVLIHFCLPAMRALLLGRPKRSRSDVKASFCVGNAPCRSGAGPTR